MTPYERLVAKTFNERLKVAATLANTLGAGTVVAGGIAPLAADKPPGAWGWFFLTGTAIALHVLAHAVLTFLVSED